MTSRKAAVYITDYKTNSTSTLANQKCDECQLKLTKDIFNCLKKIGSACFTLISTFITASIIFTAWVEFIHVDSIITNGEDVWWGQNNMTYY